MAGSTGTRVFKILATALNNAPISPSSRSERVSLEFPVLASTIVNFQTSASFMIKKYISYCGFNLHFFDY